MKCWANFCGGGDLLHSYIFHTEVFFRMKFYFIILKFKPKKTLPKIVLSETKEYLN